MRTTIINNIKMRMQSYTDLISEIVSSDLNEKLGVPKSKSLAEHLWCIVGSRESYANALTVGQWQGFSCSMKKYDQCDFELALISSGEALIAAIESISEWSPERDQLLASIAEHEVMHEGQIIRHMYGLGRTLPASWKWA